MIKGIGLLMLTLLSTSLFAQIENPVTWFSMSRKKSDKVYEVVLSASLKKPWHIYSQHTADGGPLPTKITFAANPLIQLAGQAVENGSLETIHDEGFDVEVKYFADKVEFVQTVKMKGNVRTNVKGKVEYMVCNDGKCLPPAKYPFDIKIQ